MRRRADHPIRRVEPPDKVADTPEIQCRFTPPMCLYPMYVPSLYPSMYLVDRTLTG